MEKEGAIVDYRVPTAIAGVLAVLLAGFAVGRQGEGDGGVGGPAFAVLGFMLCSSLLLVLNKIAVTMYPYPITLLTLQLVSAALCMWVLGAMGLICGVEPLELKKILDFGVIPIAFLLTLVANIKILEFANMETFIMVRNSTPLGIAILDWIFLGRELPDFRSWLALLTAAAGATGYMYFDAEFEIRAYSWSACWLGIFLFDQIYIKHVITTVRMKNWTRVYYTNAVALAPVVLFSVLLEDAPRNLGNYTNGPVWMGASIVGMSCVMGTAMSFFAFYARDSISATSFTVVGNICKVLSVLLNVIIWDKHASPSGLFALLVCITGSGIYRPAPPREKVLMPSKEAPKVNTSDENEVEKK